MVRRTPSTIVDADRTAAVVTSPTPSTACTRAKSATSGCPDVSITTVGVSAPSTPTVIPTSTAKNTAGFRSGTPAGDVFMVLVDATPHRGIRDPQPRRCPSGMAAHLPPANSRHVASHHMAGTPTSPTSRRRCFGQHALFPPRPVNGRRREPQGATPPRARHRDQLSSHTPTFPPQERQPLLVQPGCSRLSTLAMPQHSLRSSPNGHIDDVRSGGGDGRLGG